MLPYLDSWKPQILSVLRLVTGLLMLEHGLTKLFQFPYVEQFAHTQLYTLEWYSAVIELGGGIFLTLGLFTRPIAFILSGEMAFAYFLVHAPRSFFPVINGGELAIVYCFLFLYLADAGGGSWSLDALLRRNKLA
jgi:putative oxidoreductase